MKRLCVYCGSSPGTHPRYLEAARAIGRLCAEQGIGVVYGGAKVGCMGAVADAALEAGGEVLGVIPHGLVQLEVGHTGLTRLEVVDTLHERKARFEELSDAFVVLPGGHGSHDELFEALTWLQLAIHHKPIAVLNLEGYYDLLLQHLDRCVEEGFIRPAHRSTLLVADRPEEVLPVLQGFEPPERPVWAGSAPRP